MRLLVNGRSSRALFALICSFAVLALSCGPASRQEGQATGETGSRSSGPKTLRMAVVDEPRSGIAIFSAGGTGGADPSLVFHSGLTVYDDRGQPTPRLAAKVPRLEDGDWVVQPDGRMELIWKLRPNVKWHDGTPLSVDDFLFGARILRDDELPATRATWLRLVTDITAPDAETLVVSWRQPYILANASGPTDIPAVPRHLMGDLYQAGDKQAFLNNLYWTREFVGLGPFKLTDWQLGSFLEGVAFDDYFLGRPKVDRVVTHYFPDVNALVANLLAGEIDVVPAGALKTEQIIATKQNWEAAGKGTVTPIMNGLRVNWFQYRDPTLPWATDVRVRQALVHMLDRQAIAKNAGIWAHDHRGHAAHAR